MIRGKTFSLNGKDYVIPPLSLGQLRSGGTELLKRHDELINANAPLAEVISIRGEVIAMALRRNYGDITDDAVYDLLDMGNVNEIWMVVLGLSGLTSGEVQAPTEGPKLNGISGLSTADSAPLTAGN